MPNSQQMLRTLADRYQALVAAAEIESDPAQLAVVATLDRLSERLAEVRLASKKSALGWMFARKAPKPETVRGLYVWGEVGRGKTMLMDMFFELAPVRRKRRAHFHEFMADTQERIHRARQAILKGEIKGDDPIAPVAEAIVEETRLLCFDEFSVTDIADAMILGRLFTRLFDAGVVMVATSNVAPENLYRDGLNRALFLPFLGTLARHVDVVRLDARTDFRLEKLEGAPVYWVPADGAADAGMAALFKRLSGQAHGKPASLDVKGRQVAVPEAAQGVARFHFDDLCRRPLAAADYLKIAHAYHTVFVAGVPVMGEAERNEAKRFILLVDAFYDNRVKLVLSAAAEPGGLYPVSTGTEAFEFQRTVSRLVEMRSEAWLALPHGAVEGAAPPTAERSA